jgi:hypothetical protein
LGPGSVSELTSSGPGLTLTVCRSGRSAGCLLRPSADLTCLVHSREANLPSADRCQPIGHVPPSWFPTTSTVCSKTGAQAYCSPLPAGVRSASAAVGRRPGRLPSAALRSAYTLESLVSTIQPLHSERVGFECRDNGAFRYQAAVCHLGLAICHQAVCLRQEMKVTTNPTARLDTRRYRDGLPSGQVTSLPLTPQSATCRSHHTRVAAHNLAVACLGSNGLLGSRPTCPLAPTP